MKRRGFMAAALGLLVWPFSKPVKASEVESFSVTLPQIGDKWHRGLRDYSVMFVSDLQFKPSVIDSVDVERFQADKNLWLITIHYKSDQDKFDNGT